MLLTTESATAINVILLTTAHNLSVMTSVNRTKKDGTEEEVFCPKAVTIYNAVMLFYDVDHFDICKMMASHLLFSY